MSFEKAAPDHNRPQLFSRSRMWVQFPHSGSGEKSQYQGVRHRPGGLAPPNHPDPSRTYPGPGPKSPTTLYQLGAEPHQWRQRWALSATGARSQETLLLKATGSCPSHSPGSKAGCHPITGISQLWGGPRSFAVNLTAGGNSLNKSSDPTGHPEQGHCNFPLCLVTRPCLAPRPHASTDEIPRLPEGRAQGAQQ